MLSLHRLSANRRFQLCLNSFFSIICLLHLNGCGLVLKNVSSDVLFELSDAILNQDDPELVREALPAYLILLDSFIRSNPTDSDALITGALLYSAYGGVFVDDPLRAANLTAHSRDYGNRAICAVLQESCELQGKDFEAYTRIIQLLNKSDSFVLYGYIVSNLAWIRNHVDDYEAIASLPKMEVALEHFMTIDPGDYAASASMYLGMLKTLRPAALGGEPESGRVWFERGIELSGGQDLTIKVEYARSYARLIYDRELHDRLLKEVISSNVKENNLILFNILAREQAKELLETADEFF